MTLVHHNNESGKNYWIPKLHKKWTTQWYPCWAVCHEDTIKYQWVLSIYFDSNVTKDAQKLVDPQTDHKSLLTQFYMWDKTHLLVEFENSNFFWKSYLLIWVIVKCKDEVQIQTGKNNYLSHMIYPLHQLKPNT